MRRIQASEAKSHLLQLLDQVEQGESFVITRHHRPIARLVPETAQAQAQAARALEEIARLRRHTAPVAIAELLSARDEGRR